MNRTSPFQLRNRALTLGLVALLAAAPYALARKKAAKPTLRVAPPEVQEALRGEVVMQDKKSVFTAPKPPTTAPGQPPRVNRSPFWPVGWVPGMKKKEEAPVTKIVPSEIFAITSIMLGPPDLVVINGKRYEAGQDVPVALGQKTLNFRIVQIRDGEITMQHGNQQFPVPRKGRNPDKAGQAQN